MRHTPCLSQDHLRLCVSSVDVKCDDVGLTYHSRCASHCMCSTTRHHNGMPCCQPFQSVVPVWKQAHTSPSALHNQKQTTATWHVARGSKCLFTKGAHRPPGAGDLAPPHNTVWVLRGVAHPPKEGMAQKKKHINNNDTDPSESASIRPPIIYMGRNKASCCTSSSCFWATQGPHTAGCGPPTGRATLRVSRPTGRATLRVPT